MKTLKHRPATNRPSPEAALSIATSAAPSFPPAQIGPQDRPTTLNIRVRTSTVAAITGRARERGLTIKQVVCHAPAEGTAGRLLALADEAGGRAGRAPNRL